MLKKLLARHRVLRLGASLLGASALAVGFASPALAAQSSGGTAPSVNYNIFQGGSNTTFLMMTALSDLFNAAPGCDMVGPSGTPQPLDYSCPGLNGAPGGPTLSHPVLSANPNSTVTNLAKGVTGLISTSSYLAGMAVSDSLGDIPAGDTIKSVLSATSIKLKVAATGSSTTDTVTVTTTPGVGENGFVQWGNENPFNDVLIQEPALGSSNGIQELENQGSHGPGYTSHSVAVNTAPLDVARSSRFPNLSGSTAGDDRGLNFVGYAMDAVSWLHWTSVNGVATPSAGVHNLTVAQLSSIFSGATTDWSALPGGTAGPIVLYFAQCGSGTEGTWQSLLGFTTCPGGPENSHHVIFENQTADILANHDQANAIFFFSFGKYKQICTPNPSFCSGSTTSATELGQINGITANTGSITAQLPHASGTPFPGDRIVNNVYSDGANPLIPVSSNASLNAVSEAGFLCKPATAQDIDPNTGATYRSEINSTITKQGFLPLPLVIEDGNGSATAPFTTTAGGINSPAWVTGELKGSNYDGSVEAAAPWTFPAANLDTDSSAANGSYAGVLGAVGNTTATPTNPVGYCLVTTTDGNTTN